LHVIYQRMLLTVVAYFHQLANLIELNMQHVQIIVVVVVVVVVVINLVTFFFQFINLQTQTMWVRLQASWLQLFL